MPFDRICQIDIVVNHFVYLQQCANCIPSAELLFGKEFCHLVYDVEIIEKVTDNLVLHTDVHLIVRNLKHILAFLKRLRPPHVMMRIIFQRDFQPLPCRLSLCQQVTVMISVAVLNYLRGEVPIGLFVNPEHSLIALDLRKDEKGLSCQLFRYGVIAQKPAIQSLLQPLSSPFTRTKQPSIRHLMHRLLRCPDAHFHLVHRNKHPIMQHFFQTF